MSTTLDVLLTPDQLRDALATDVRAGLTSTPKRLPPKWFYDELGSKLFDEITRLPEYYPSRRETEVLATHAADIVRGYDSYTELGAGLSPKTKLLLDAMNRTGSLRDVALLDVSEAALCGAMEWLEGAYLGVPARGVVGDFSCHLDALPTDGRRLVTFLGGTIGNLPPAQRRELLAALRRHIAPGGALLIGADLVKDVERLVAAYDDSAGVTAEFNRNVLRVINSELDADFAPESFDHVAAWDDENEWIDIRLRSTRAQSVEVRALGLRIHFADGEEIHTEISAKFRLPRLRAELMEAGFGSLRVFTDPARDFAVVLATS